MITDLTLPADIEKLLKCHHFNSEAFSALRADLANGAFPASRNQVHDTIAVPNDDDLTAWAPEGSDTAARWQHLGEQAIASGQVGVMILNGGMATRFGGVVKGVVEVLDGQSFLGLRLRDVREAKGDVPVFLMNSFTTAEATKAHLEANNYFGVPKAHIHNLTQRISLRLTPEGELFKNAAGNPVPYAPGHGDVFEVLAESPAFQSFKAAGGRMLLLGNVDNLAANLSPKVIGAHIDGGRAISVEVTARATNDKGGAPVRRAGRVEILEGFRFPADFDISQIPVFNTNTLIANTDAIRPDFPLTWFRADKQVEGKAVVQFERLMGEVTSYVDSTWIVVPREGAEGRFMPVKTPEDLQTMQQALRARLGM